MRSRSGAELPQLELECLAALWALEQAPVAQVHARLAERGRPLAYTTVLTVLDRLLRKRVVERTREGRAYVYRPLVTREEMRERAIARLVANYFDSRQEMQRYLHGAAHADTARGDNGTAGEAGLGPAAEPEPELALLD